MERRDRSDRSRRAGVVELAAITRPMEKNQNILVLGGSGMLGHKLFQVMTGSFEVWVTFQKTAGPWSRIPLYRDTPRVVTGVDALQFETIGTAVRRLRPDVVLNCIGVVKQLDEAG